MGLDTWGTTYARNPAHPQAVSRLAQCLTEEPTVMGVLPSDPIPAFFTQLFDRVLGMVSHRGRESTVRRTARRLIVSPKNPDC